MKSSGHKFILIPVYFFIFFTVKSMSKRLKKDQWNWFEAQEICMNNNESLKLNNLWTSPTDYWSGIYLRYSSQIHIQGCFSAENDKFRTSRALVMKYPSVGFCQEICATENANEFGIQVEKCVCFQYHISTGIVPPSECNESCAKYTEGVTFTDCGGRNAYSFYVSEKGTARKGTYCSAVKCGSTKKFHFSSDCSELYFALCEAKENRTTTEKTYNWTQAMQFCKTSLPSSYLVGSVSFVDADKACKQLNSTQEGFSWLGIITEVYFGNDRGLKIKKDDKDSFYQCQRCNADGCSFDLCSEKLETILCEKGLQIEATTRDIFYSSRIRSEVLKTTSSQPTDINITTKTYGTPKDSSTPIGIIVSMVIAFALILCSGIAIFLYIRKKKSNFITKDSKIQRSNVKSINNAERIDEHFTDINYFVLEPTSESSRNSNATKEDLSYPYLEKQEGTYDHLQDNYKRQKENENMYDHTSTGIKQDYGGYGIGEKKENIEDTYDHASPSSDYGHVTHVPPEQINSEYDKVINISQKNRVHLTD